MIGFVIVLAGVTSTVWVFSAITRRQVFLVLVEIYKSLIAYELRRCFHAVFWQSLTR